MSENQFICSMLMYAVQTMETKKMPRELKTQV